ncbi:meiosis-specific nuclear structural protein 1 [Chrysochromulina tobinii]|uniref:Meiosis-specific nuclear structural protein 1 n=2 Tax=Chrysochromulina tobinii TaxID=1460289 RepID=A0A0M0J3F7_9EUKA|nr:meiosis-specific nuclear structural protein 1 [Chrysochromulina tobinii]|eukprot:KOO21091.1 meiosis-specific nuclear structural protein 1 [Chrysochromulina sp. CCMP291]
MAQVRRYEAKLATQRIKDNFTLELEKTIQTDRMLGENFRSDGRVVQTRITNEQKAAQQNMYATQQLMSASIAQQREAVLREQDERLAAEIARRKTQAVREAKNVQRICEQSEELRALEEKLKAAYMNKERECQIKESAHLIAKQAESESIMAQTMEADRQRGLQAEAYREYLRQQDGRAMRAELDKQVQEKMTLKAEAYQQFLKEKEMVDKVVEAIIEEDRRETEARHAKEKEIKSYIDAFIVQQEEYKHKRRVEIEEENAKIRAYAEHVMAREQAMRLEREKDQNAKDAALEKISGDMAARQREKDEMDNLRNELVIQETEEKILQKEKEKMARAVQQRMDIALANEYQRQLKAIRREEEKQEEEGFRVAMLAKFAEDDRLDQMNAQKRRMKQLEHRKAIEQLLELRRAKYEQERGAELQEQLNAERVEQVRQQIIEEERKRMLAAHAKNLGLQHLPKGILSSEADLALFAAPK